MAEEKRKKQQMAMMVGGAVAVAAVGYWYYSSQSQGAKEEEGSNYAEDKVEEMTFSGDADRVKKAENDYSASFDDRKTLEDEDSAAMTTEQDANGVMPSGSASMTVNDVEAKESMDTAPNEADSAKNVVTEPEESPVIVEPTAEEVAAQKMKEEEAERQRVREMERQREAEKERERERERESVRLREEQRLQALVRKYDAIADRVGKYKSFRYKNGKLRVKVLRATNVDKRDMGKTDFSDVYVKMEVPKGKTLKSSVKKDMQNPVWNEQFEMNVRDALKDRLTLTVMDHDIATMDDTIGTVEVDIVDICASNESQIVGRAFDVKGSKKGCKLYVDLAYSEEAPKKK